MPRLHAALIRVPEALYRELAEIARRRGVSPDELVQEVLERVVRDEHYAEMYDAASLLGLDHAECDVEYAIPAQAEVMLRDEP